LREQNETYKDIQITYSIPQDKRYVGDVKIKIGDKHIHAIRLSDGSYGTHFLPFKNYDSVEQLAKDIVDKVPYFRELS
jgi:hypothetical protein